MDTKDLIKAYMTYNNQVQQQHAGRLWSCNYLRLRGW